ncbi:MAG: type II toxin-antitoxin system RelE/ParE family toxin [Alphaproteobacteria bacterium]|nr:type II toxin-antitoxin system RelE/ParE family toxin [Alphaproteobacteria bacterium]
MKIVWLLRAMRDRDAQIDFIAQDNPLAAVNAGDAITAQIGMLVDQPEIGRPGRRAGTRELVISRTPFVAVYRVTGGRIEVLRLLHGSQQWPSA